MIFLFGIFFIYDVGFGIYDYFIYDVGFGIYDCLEKVSPLGRFRGVSYFYNIQRNANFVQKIARLSKRCL
jgi:hypothetical protein